MNSRVLTINDILKVEEIEPDSVAVMLHTPKERKLARVLLWLVHARPAAFEAFQSTHSKGAGATIKRRRNVASFVATGRGTFVFAGLYHVEEIRKRRLNEIWMEPEVRYLIEEFDTDFGQLDRQGEELEDWFGLTLDGRLAAYRGRLSIRPKATRAYTRLAEKLEAPVVAISEEPVWAQVPPHWTELILTTAEIHNLPPSWAARIAEWRGIYLITDESDGERYVGSAYGRENIIGRWRVHVAGSMGATKELRQRNTKNFRFSILERVSPDLAARDVIRLERSWMQRLHTCSFGLNH